MADEKPKWYQNKIERNREYNKENNTRLQLAFNNNTDADIIQHLKTIDNKQGYIKQLIRDDMAKK